MIAVDFACFTTRTMIGDAKCAAAAAAAAAGMARSASPAVELVEVGLEIRGIMIVHRDARLGRIAARISGSSGIALGVRRRWHDGLRARLSQRLQHAIPR
ncbi:MAG: hypothetical protein WB611_08715 [Stellaceae bacterium]